ncbi:MAG TPA: TetR/AcrR family transcriptional regulator, partial [Pseudomonadales bacterium]|nr:TetR/AcrR family transcriptional regulator [Pseudomonadales bacterium]
TNPAVTFTPKRERILDAAEELFALHGYDGVTLRQIAKKAGVDVALANYHFGKKQELFEATFLRRAQMLNDVRIQSLLEAERRAGSELTIEDIVAAFLRPIQQLLQEDEQSWGYYYALVAYVNSSAVWGRTMMHEHFDPLVSRYIAAFHQVFPDTEMEKIHWCYQYLSGALTLTLAQTGRIDRLSEGLCQSTDVQTAYDLMIPFVAAGFREVCSLGHKT